ncbi:MULTISPECIES: alpha/beta fold hydrolase [Nocardiaceae]|uniref:alpha/beta fold hydrolase n=1 Tax=Nocardiaceae TaxID=85025 RepID=UPI000B0F4C29|nr:MULTISPECIES: alpha/beta hydrolase [Rhodococcus]
MIEPRTEEFADVGRDVRLCFERLGDPAGSPLLLVAGLGQQLVSWPTPLCDALGEGGFQIIRFDNRDTGRSTHSAAAPPGLRALLTGRYPSDTYGLHDMARDTVGLLDALQIERAHVVGASMGGMIAQTVASRWPSRVESLTSIFSTTGAARIGRPAWSTWIRMMSPGPTSAGEAADSDVAIFAHIGSHGYEQDTAWVREQATVAWARDPRTDGIARQLAAILATGDRTSELSRITAPTLVIHGDRDRMVAPSGGLATHHAIAGSHLRIIAGMGHDYPRALWPELSSLIVDHARSADLQEYTDVSSTT